MAIANVTVSAGQAHIFDEKGHKLKILGLAGGELVGFTSTTISIKRSGKIWLYNEKGSQVGSTPIK